MEEAKALIRTAVRSFFTEPRQILLIDALMLHGVLHLEDVHDLLGIQPKEARGYLQPLRNLRFCATHSRKELSLKHNREVNREYYWCRFSDAVNVIKYRIIQLRHEVMLEYQVKAGPDYYRCDRCGSTFAELDIIPSGPEMDLLCLRCGKELLVNEAALKDKDSHEGIMKLNEQLSKFNTLIAAVDSKIVRGEFKEPTFDEAFIRRKKVPTSISGRKHDNYAEIKRGRERDKAAGAVDEDAINVNLTSAAALSKEEAEREAERKKRIQDNSLLPEWHQGGAIRGATMDVRGEPTTSTVKPDPDASTSTTNPPTTSTTLNIKPEDSDEKKPLLTSNTTTTLPSATDDAAMERYVQEMALEQAALDRERQRAAEFGSSSSAAGDSDDPDDSDDDEEFGDVPLTNAAGTPMSSQENTVVKKQEGNSKGGVLGKGQLNGIKREFEDDSSEAATPASMGSSERESKRVKTEANGRQGVGADIPSAAAAAGAGLESDEDDEQFEDV